MAADVEISNTAINMISSMHDGDQVRVRETLAAVEADVRDPSRVRRLPDYPDVFVARGRGLRVIFRTSGGKAFVTTVAKEG
jgi:hypothetical protein